MLDKVSALIDSIPQKTDLGKLIDEMFTAF